MCQVTEELRMIVHILIAFLAPLAERSERIVQFIMVIPMKVVFDGDQAATMNGQ